MWISRNLCHVTFLGTNFRPAFLLNLFEIRITSFTLTLSKTLLDPKEFLNSKPYLLEQSRRYYTKCKL